MERKHLPSNLTDEELLALSDKNDAKEVFDSDIYFFVSTFNLQPGENKLAITFLYDLYTRWSKKRMGFKRFHDDVKRMFPVVSVENKIYVCIDSSVAQITKKMVESVQTTFNPKKLNIQKYLERFMTYWGIEKGKSWMDEKQVWDLYLLWKTGKGELSREDFMDGLRAILPMRFNRKNLREFAVDSEKINQKKEASGQEEILSKS